MNDHSIFNEENPNDFPTTEVVARKIYELVQEYLDTLPNKPSCVQVFVRETPTSYVVYRPKKVKNVANTIPVLEIFGPTIQGEGMVVGRKTMFVRTAGCDYSCSWCDSAFTWDGSAKTIFVS